MLYRPGTNARIKGYDYRHGYFFVTNQTNYSKTFLVGEIREMADEELHKLGKMIPGVTVDTVVIMPTHIHCILIFEEAKFDLSEVWRRFKSITTRKFNLMRSDKSDHYISRSLWQQNYYERIVRNEFELYKIREYIVNNPLSASLDGLLATFAGKQIKQS